jgi:predicted DNA-binding transcriptional regulator AlpA
MPHLMTKPKIRSSEYIELNGRAFIRAAAVLDITTWSRWTLWRRVKAGTFPRPVRFGARDWFAFDEVTQVLNDTFEVRDNPQTRASRESRPEANHSLAFAPGGRN